MSSSRPNPARHGGGGHERLSRIIETQRDLAAAGGSARTVMQLMAERCQALTGADGAMVSVLQDGDTLLTTAATGCAAGVIGAVRPLRDSVARHAIEGGEALLIENCETDPRINRELQRQVGDRSLICVPLLTGATVTGSLNVMTRDSSKLLTEEDRDTMEMLSVVLSAALSNAGQHEAVARFRTLFEGASIGILLIGPDECAREANPAVAQMLGYDAAELATMPFRKYTHPGDVARSAELFAEMMADRRESYQVEVRYCRRDGGVLWTQHTAVLERDADGLPAFAVTMIEDITQRKATEEELIRESDLRRHQATHDPLTGLPNRVRFAECIQRAIADAARERELCAVVMLDLDRFKEVNDSLGHHAGDVVLKDVGSRVQKRLRGSDVVARLGGDEFGILLCGASRSEDFVAVVERVARALERPVDLHGRMLDMSGSIGIAVFPDDGRDMDTLLRRADAAMYDAKQHGRPYVFYGAPGDRPVAAR
jgi:diguanylate cyclase (GGDEF)-like protein/PAS domain S-box-containing protein